MSQPSSVFFAFKIATLAPELQVYGSQPSSVVLCIENSDFRARFTSHYGSQTSPMFFFAFKTAALAPELQVSMGPSPHL